MSNTAELITITEAEKLTGLARSTLIRFAEAGYFTTSSNPSGEQLLATEELCRLFNITIPANADKREISSAFTSEESNNSDQAQSDPIQAIGRCSADFAGGAFIAKQKKRVNSPASDTDETTEIQNTEQPLATNINSINTELKESPTVTLLVPDITLESNSTENEDNRIAIQAELNKLQKVIELQEQLLDARDAEIRDLKKQRKWLQERIEKQELKGERDQLLLISEMQMLTKMYQQQHQKKSVVIQTLEWFGFKNQSADRQDLPVYQINDQKE